MKRKVTKVNKKKLRKYSFGKPITKSGYERAQTIDTSLLNETPGFGGYGQNADTIRGSIFPSYVGNAATSLLGAGQNVLNNTISQSAANFANAHVAEFIDAAGNTTAKGVEALNSIGQGAQGIGAKMTADQVAALADASKEAAGSAAKNAGMNAVGKAAAALQIAQGGYNMLGGLTSYADNLGIEDVNATRSRGTNIRNGVAYDYIGGADQSGIMDYTDAQNSQSRSEVVQGSSQIGSGVGAIVGTGIGGPVGGLIGSGLGYLGGALTGWITDGILGLGSKRKRRVQEAIRNSALQADAQNAQNESIAGSQGLRNQYYQTHMADKGKDLDQRWSDGKIATVDGGSYGEPLGLASPDEGQVDMLTGETQYNGSPLQAVQDKRNDVVPVGAPIGQSNQYFDKYIGIPGHRRDLDGIMFADKARPLFKQNEQIKQQMADVEAQIEENDMHKKRNESTKRFVNKRLQQKAEHLRSMYQQNSESLKDLVMRQTELSDIDRYSCGKNARFTNGKLPKFDLGDNITPEMLQRWTEDLSKTTERTNPTLTQSAVDLINTDPSIKANGFKPIDIKYPTKKAEEELVYEPVRNNIGLPAYAGLAQALPYLIRTSNFAHGQQPYAHNSYRANPYAGQALSILGNLGYNNAQDHIRTNNAVRSQLYNINRAGNLTAGQKAALANDLQLKAQAQHAALNEAWYDKNATIKQALANTLANLGYQQASMMQQAATTQQDMFAKAVGAKQKLMAQADKNWYTVGRQAIQDWNTDDLYSRMLDLYNVQYKPIVRKKKTSGKEQV